MFIRNISIKKPLCHAQLTEDHVAAALGIHLRGIRDDSFKFVERFRPANKYIGVDIICITEKPMLQIISIDHIYYEYIY